MIYTHIAAAVIAALAVWFFQDSRHAAELAELRLQNADAVIQFAAQERARQNAITTKYQGVLNEARNRETVLRRHLDTAARESDGLRTQLSDAARRIAAATPATVAEYALTADELLADCSRRYQELAGKADGHAADARTLTEAWPVITDDANH